ncbi:MAG: hypothetical protein ACTSYR_00275, partial [Candidatus Odinarchaeia archaeon]
LVNDFTAQAAIGSTSRYRFLVEFAKNPKDPIKFLKDVDAALMRFNRIYAQCREMGLIGKPELIILPKGSHRKYGELMAQKGKPLGQFKPQRISSMSGFFKEIIEENSIQSMSF